MYGYWSSSTQLHGKGELTYPGLTTAFEFTWRAAVMPELSVCTSGCDYSSIQAAIDAAPPPPGRTTIMVDAGTYAGGLNTDGKDLTVLGAGADQTTIEGGGPAVEISSGTVTIEGVTIAGARTGSSGGGIVNSGTLTLRRSRVSDNAAHVDGGGIFNDRGALTLEDSTVSENRAASGGGGIFRAGRGFTMKGDSRVARNQAHHGGGIATHSSIVMLEDSVVDNNEAGADGGGVYGMDGTMTLRHASVIHNLAISDGGGLYNRHGAVSLQLSTARYNIARRHGGGIFNTGSGTVVLTDSTIDANTPEDGCYGC